MMNEADFWQIIEASLEQEAVVGSMEQDGVLIQILEAKTTDELVRFQLRLFNLRAGLNKEHIRQIAEQLEYTGHTDVFDRFKNGMIASGRAFYDKAKDNPEFLNTLLVNHPQALKNCYYEGLGLVAPAAFYELTDYKENWDQALQKGRRVMEIQQPEVDCERKNGLDLER